uniref:AMP-dependent synthetase/ligase domain-containing protein n=1 Tax=Anopheles atroparvus TaxID=41427 RepID=A0AAG5DVV5_ANOAO
MDLLDSTVFFKFKNRSALKFYDSRCRLIEVNYGQLWQDMQKIASSLQGQQIEGQMIGVLLPHCPALIAVIGGIIISGNSFICLNDTGHSDYSSLKRNKECTAFLLPGRGSYDECDGLQLLVGMQIASMHIVLIVGPSTQASNKDIAFCVRTSGSTGAPKTVAVPKSCIMPNVLTLGTQFKLCERDVIFVCSPPTFDPFVIDILLGLRVGATLMLVENEIRLSPNRLTNVLFPGVTFMQITPSLFTRWSSQVIAETILAPHSSLRILVLGGEKFPRLPVPPGSRTDIYNIYGITEISCWSMMEQVTYDNRSDVPLGTALDSSLIFELRCVENDQQLAEKNETGSIIGHLFIGSRTRKCIVLEDMASITSGKPLFRSTGDVVELTTDNQYFYRGRCERIIKRFGCRVSLHLLEETVLSHEAIEQSAACVIGDDVRLVLFFKSSDRHACIEATLWNYLRAKLPAEKLPDEIYRTEEIPLSSHGKISNDGLLKLYDQCKRRQSFERFTSVGFFRAELLAMGILHHSVPENDDTKRRKLGSFTDHGGTSIAALRLHATMEKAQGAVLPDLLTYLLDSTVSLEEVFKYLELNDKTNSLAGEQSSSKEQFTDLIGDGDKFTIVCRYDMGKCIDARPTVVFCKDFGHILSIGSHSGLLLTIGVESNDTISRLSLPDRIECPASFFTLKSETIHGVVGCYDGYLYCFNPLNGRIIWKYNAGGMIKCCPLVVPETNVIIFGSYGSSHNLHCLRGSDGGAVKWKLKIGTKPILAQPIAFSSDGTGCVCVTTLDGTIASVSVATGKIVWSSVVLRIVPIFTTPAYFDEYGKVIVCRVDGAMSVHEIVKGKETSSIRLPGNVFSSFEIFRRSTNRINLLVGCYDRSVHSVEYLPQQRDALERKWKVDMQSQIYATPVIVGHYMVVCTTSGCINLVDLVNEDTQGGGSVKIVSTLQMNGELFAAPVAHGKVVFVGCRDNFLYKIFLKV